MFGGFEFVILTVLFWVVTVWVFYMVIKAAVRNGILEADKAREARLRRASDPSAAPGALTRAVAESQRKVPAEEA